MQLRDKRVTVVGLARSGVGAANLLASHRAVVTVTDSKPEAELRSQLARLHPSVRCVFGRHPDDIFSSADLVVVSPGVPLAIPPLVMAVSRGIPVIGELELAYAVLTECAPGYAASFLAVTGSNGKSTTTTLLDLMLRKAGRRTVLAGNIGNALSEEISSRGMCDAGGARYGGIVLEVSSFQLEAIRAFRPAVASILNITPDHLDRYHSLAEYAGAKARIFGQQGPDDALVLNADDPGTMLIHGERLAGREGRGPRVFFFSRLREVPGVYFRGGMIYADIPGGKGGPKLPLLHAEELMIKGVHNLENAMAASAMALLADCPPGAVIESLREFPGLEHRLEFVREMDGVRYFNDSKGTNVGAVVKSLESFEQPLILIAGGRDKAGDFTALRGLAAQRVKAMVLIGEAAGKIQKALGDVTRAVMVRDLTEAVSAARALAVRGDVVLLSPACASFDMFRDFEDRGRQFKEIVRGLTA